MWWGVQAAAAKVAHLYTGEQDSEAALAMKRCDPKGPLMINVVKLYSSPEGDSFQAFGRIYSGAIQNGDEVGGGRHTYSQLASPHSLTHWLNQATATHMIGTAAASRPRRSEGLRVGAWLVLVLC